jgi:hemolysin activation/secretion protein
LLKYTLYGAALLGLSNPAFAQVSPNVGGQIQQIPPAPTLPPSAPDLNIQKRQTAPSIGRPGPKVLVHALVVTGQTLFSEQDLISATGFIPDRELDLAQLREMAGRITRYYNQRGYFIAQAYLPAQAIEGGTVRIAVLEGSYDKIALKNGSRLSDRVAWGVLDGMGNGDPIALAPLERRLLLLSDIPGVAVSSTLAPGNAVGTSDLDVRVRSTPLISGSLEADDAGDRYTGSYRGGGTLNINDPFGLGDLATVRVLTSGSGLTYVRGAYQLEVGDATVGAAYTHFQYHLGKEFAALDASGTEDIGSLYASYPLVRTRDNNLYALADVDERRFEDDVGQTSSQSNRRDAVLTLGLYGNHSDRLWGGGADAFSIAVSGGDLDLRTESGRALDATTARTNGDYVKLAFMADRLQTIYGPFSIYGDLRGQLASKNLDISEKMELGGAYGVRAYPEGEAYGDEGYVGTVEGRYLLPSLARGFPGRVQLIAFFDTGSVRLYENPYIAGPNTLTRSGAGVGANWIASNNFEVKASYAFKLTGPATSAPDRSGQFWIEVVKYF